MLETLLRVIKSAPTPWALLALLAAANHALANDFTDLVVSSGYEENLPRGFLDKDIHSSEFINTALTVGKLYQPGINTSVVVSATASYNQYFSQRGFNFASLGAGLSIQQKLGMGAYTPRIGLSLGAGRENSRGAERDRELYSAELSLSKRVSSALNFSIGLGVQTSRGTSEPEVDFDSLPYRPGVTRPHDPMDYRNRSAFTGVDYALNNGWLLSAGYRYLDGYIVSSAVPPVVLFRYTEAVALDPAYDRLRLMYLMEATADMFSTGLSIPINRDTAIDVGYHWQEFDVDYVGGYDNSQFLISLVHQF